MAKYCTRKAKGPFPLLTWDLSEPFDREKWECFINLRPEGIICPSFKEKIPQSLSGWCPALRAEAFERTLAKAGPDPGAVFPPQ